ncbi:hypothetical protein TSAR_009357, partial [Trichomalopsis sarcophagae]
SHGFEGDCFFFYTGFFYLGFAENFRHLSFADERVRDGWKSILTLVFPKMNYLFVYYNCLPLAKVCVAFRFAINSSLATRNKNTYFLETNK